MIIYVYRVLLYFTDCFDGRTTNNQNDNDVNTRVKQNLRMRKSKIMKQLGKLSTRLKAAQLIEHCSFLFVVHEKITNKFKFYGYWDLRTKFNSGQPLEFPTEKQIL